MQTIRLFWRESGAIPRSLMVIVACLVCAMACATWLLAPAPHVDRRPVRPAIPHVEKQALPEPLKTGYLPVSTVEAKAINAGVALSTAPLEVARPFFLAPNDRIRLGETPDEALTNRNLALDCLTAAVYYEAASESMQGQRAVAQVVLNRLRHPAFPKSICGVVYEGSERATGCQFTFTCDGALARRPSQNGWKRARTIALAALAGVVEPSVGTATHYHADWVVPYWAPSLDKVTAIGAHIFYRWKGYWGKRSAFAGVYAGEPITSPPKGMVYDLETDMSDMVEGGKVPENRTRLLADQVSYAGPEHQLAVSAAPEPRADQGKGTLLADQQHGVLADIRPKAQAAATSVP